jgi:hypothetical protein
MNLKNELLKIYVNRIADFQHIHELCTDTYYGPLLMYPNEKFSRQPFSFLVIGRETNGWDTFNYPVTEDACKKMMNAYEEFNVGVNYYASPFWNVVRKIEATLGNEPCSCVWTNISKYDQDCGQPDAEHEKIFSLVDNLLIDEIKIVKPKICIFFVSYRFDYRIKNLFKNVEFLPVDGFSLHQMCQIKHKDLPVFTYRTYHPRYLRQGGLENKFLEIINNLNRK